MGGNRVLVQREHVRIRRVVGGDRPDPGLGRPADRRLLRQAQASAAELRRRPGHLTAARPSWSAMSQAKAAGRSPHEDDGAQVEVELGIAERLREPILELDRMRVVVRHVALGGVVAARRARVHGRAPRATGRRRPRRRLGVARLPPSRPPVPSTARSVLPRTRAAGERPRLARRPGRSIRADGRRAGRCAPRPSRRGASRGRDGGRRAAHPTRCPRSLPPEAPSAGASSRTRRPRHGYRLPRARIAARSGCCSIQWTRPCAVTTSSAQSS